MKEFSIPLLTEQDIDCRVQSVSKAKTGRVGAVLLLYKDARVDMRILRPGLRAWQLAENPRSNQRKPVL